MSKKTIQNALINAVGVTIYVTAIASFLFHAQEIFGTNKPDTVLAPIIVLLLLVISATITGLLVFGKPVAWYLEGKKKEAVSMLISTLGFLVIITAIAILITKFFS